MNVKTLGSQDFFLLLSRPGRGIQKFAIFALHVFSRVPKVNRRLLMQQMEFIGVQSLGIIILAAIMIGAVFGIQFGQIFRIFGAESMIGAAASFALSKELAPVVGAFLVTGRAGSAIAAEISTMKVNEQIDAMRIMAVDPITYLAVPRVLASMIVMPFLAGIFVLTGVISAFLLSVTLFNIDVGVFFQKIEWITKPAHVVEGLQKAVLFGGILSTISCYKGFSALGGAKDVGKMTTQAVVTALVAILLSDFFFSYLKRWLA